MKRFIRNALLLLSLICWLACNAPHSNILVNQFIPSDTVILKFSNNTSSNIALWIDSIKIPVEHKDGNQKYTSLAISGLNKGKHSFTILSSTEIFGPDQFEIELGSIHGECKVILSKRTKFALNETLKLMPSNNAVSKTRAHLLN